MTEPLSREDIHRTMLELLAHKPEIRADGLAFCSECDSIYPCVMARARIIIDEVERSKILLALGGGGKIDE